jgi:uncharacterized membrane protein
MNQYRHDILELIGKIGIIYFAAFSVIYLIKFAETFLLYVKYHSSQVPIDIAITLVSKFTIFGIPGNIILAITGSLAVAGFGIWIYSGRRVSRDER